LSRRYTSVIVNNSTGPLTIQSSIAVVLANSLMLAPPFHGGLEWDGN
jgi:hypothetical protein